MCKKQFFPSTDLYLLNRFATKHKVFSNLHRMLMSFPKHVEIILHIESFFPLPLPLLSLEV